MASISISSRVEAVVGYNNMSGDYLTRLGYPLVIQYCANTSEQEEGEPEDEENKN
jgi:hypothetical protein